MVNQIVLEYLRINRGNYRLEDLKRKILASGYSQRDIDEAMFYLNRQSQKAVPSVPATINQINKTNIDMNANKPVSVKEGVGGDKVVQKQKKKTNWLMWLIIIWVFILFLVGGAFGYWYFFVRGAG